MEREQMWDLVEDMCFVLVFFIAVGMLLICEALTDVTTYPAYEAGVRYELPLNVEIK